MGQKFSLNTTDILVFIEKYFPNYNIIKLLTNGMLYKTLLITKDKDNTPLIVKIFLKDNYDEKDKILFTEEYQKMANIQKEIFKKKINNICPIISMEDNGKVGMIFRQYIEYNLKERIYLMPYLKNIEKIWISFQILYALNDLKKLKIIHGDLKPENILLTSNLSVYISDFACYKPAYISIDDITDYTYYFGSNRTDSMKGCYLAPERFLKKSSSSYINKKTFAMDIFSVGVIIAELFLERNIFDYTSLLNYINGNTKDFNIDEILSKIQNKNLRWLISKMISINPDERIEITEALKFFSFEICPIAMRGFLLHFNAIITSTKFWKPDLIIGHLYRFWNPIWKIIFGINENPTPLTQNLNYYIINQILLEPFSINGEHNILDKNKNNILCIGDYELIISPENGTINTKLIEENIEDITKRKNNIDCIYIIINYLLESIQYTKYDTSNLVAMEMLNYISKMLDDIVKLQLILPYFLRNLKRRKYIIQLKSLNYIFDILYSINYKDLILPVTEYNYFDGYVFPELLKFYNKEKNPYIILEFFNNIDKIIDLEEKFLNVILKSRLKKNQMNLKNIKSNDNKNIINDENDNNIDNIILGTINENDNNYDHDYLRPSRISYKESNFKVNKDRTFEIYQEYDASLEFFKSSLFSITSDLIGRSNEIDILITVIRKLPSLLLFYGRSKTNDFSKFIINNFNKTDWIIQTEILRQIPQMTMTIGEKHLNDYILPCMEMLISNNSNELKILELIRSIHQLLKMDNLALSNSIIDFYQKLLPFILHPNISIRNEIVNFSASLFNYLSPDEVFCYLYKPLEQYLAIPPIIVNKNTIISNCKKALPRIIYQLKIEDIDFDENKYQIGERNIKDEIESNYFQPFYELINNQKKGNKNTEDNGNINYYYDNFYFPDFLIRIEEYKKYSILEALEKYIKKEKALMEDFSDKGNIVETKIFGTIFYLGNNKSNFNFSDYKKNSLISFEANNNIISSDLFRIAYLLKALGISFKMYKLEELLKESNEDENLDNKIKSTQMNIVLKNYYCSKSYHNWRPQGQIVTTLYDHMSIPVEKLLPLDNSHFCSFDNKGDAILYNVKINSDDEILIQKKWEYFRKDEKEILYKNNISGLDDTSFVLSLGNTLYQYNANIPPKAMDFSLKLCKSKDDSYITCIKPHDISSKENQQILYCTENGSINLYDNRVKGNNSLDLIIPKEKGMMICISESFEKNQYLIGTLDGCLLKYDLRINSLVKDFQYSNDSPILGIYLYKYSKANDSEFSIKNNNYMILWTGSEEHEISFFDYSNLNCDLLLKLNIQSNGNDELNPLEVEIPFLEKTNNKEDDKENNIKKKVINDFKYLNQYIYLGNDNIINNYFGCQFKDENYETASQKLSNLTNIYGNPNTVQCVISPYSDCTLMQNTNNYLYDNSPYIISAGNDKVIRYWDISKDNLNTNFSKKSYIINAPNNINYCQFTKSTFENTTILQSNEIYNAKGAKLNMPGLSEFQNYNGILYHTSVQKEFEESDNDLIRYCTKISDPSHKSIITDLLPLSLNTSIDSTNLLVSSSWDGTIKIWK